MTVNNRRVTVNNRKKTDMMQFNSGSGMSRAFEHPPGTGTTLGASMREMADRNQERIRKELETGPTVMIKVPSPHFILHLNGETYGARKSPYHGWVADVCAVQFRDSD
jgi:hypothetical protein